MATKTRSWFGIRAALAAAAVIAATDAQAEDWPCWRGPRGDGTSEETGLPIRWSATENVAWKVALPGRGHASPIVRGDRVFIVAGVEEARQRVLLSIDRKTGEVRWQRVVLEAPLERHHSLNTCASSTPATDGERVYVSFLDRDAVFVAAYDLEGAKVWEVRPGPFSSIHGYCSSPLLWKGLVIVNGDHDGAGYIAALDRATGKTVWKTRRPNDTRSYCAPLIRRIGDRDQLILSGTKCVASYDPDTGLEHWIIDGPTEQFVASPVANGDLLFITAGFPELHMMAIDPTGRGNVTSTHIRWRTARDCSYVPSPIAFGPYFIVVSDEGVATSLVAKTGEVVWRERLGDGHRASIVSAEGRVYFLSDRGVATVAKPGPPLEILSKNEIGERTFASPAISGGNIFIRGENHLFAIGSAPR